MTTDPGELAARALVCGWIGIFLAGALALAVAAPPAAIIPAFFIWKLSKLLAQSSQPVT